MATIGEIQIRTDDLAQEVARLKAIVAAQTTKIATLESFLGNVVGGYNGNFTRMSDEMDAMRRVVTALSLNMRDIQMGNPFPVVDGQPSGLMIYIREIAMVEAYINFFAAVKVALDVSPVESAPKEDYDMVFGDEP